MNALDPRAPFARATIFQHALRWLAALPCAAGSLAAAPATDGWESRAARREIEPMFSFDPTSGNAGRGALIITADQRPGLTGHWVKTFPVVGGRWYSFRAYRRTHGVEAPARRAHVEIAWSDDAGKSVLRDTGESRNRYALETFPATAKNWPYMARPEFPRDGATDAQGWTEVRDRFCAPPKATRATVELHLRWAPPGARAEWSEISLAECAAPSRKVRLASIHMSGAGAKTVAQAREAYRPLIEEAAAKKANFVCLTEVLTSHLSGVGVEKAAEPIPGPSTEYFATLAKKLDLYIIAGLVERDGHLIHNTSVLVGPEGYVGKYRKVCLAANEATLWGVCAGDEFPVFDTRFGKVGMMICWDLQHPEVARALAKRGAEIIFLPIAGGNPTLASARAIENQIYLVTSVWNNTRVDWLKTGIYGYDGKLLDFIETRGVSLAEVDLDAPSYWAHIGDLKGQIARQRPEVEAPRSAGRESR